MDNSLWSSLPKPMQEQFFNLADTETKKTKNSTNLKFRNFETLKFEN